MVAQLCASILSQQAIRQPVKDDDTNLHKGIAAICYSF